MPDELPYRDELLTAVKLNLPYRHDRNYIHSTDIFPALTSLAQERWSSHAYLESLVLRRQARRQIKAYFQPAANMLGTFSIRCREGQLRGWLVETDEEVSTRIPYDESRADAAVVRGLASARFANPLPEYTTFEQLIILLKAVLNGEQPQHFWLCQVNLSGPLLKTMPLSVTLRQTILHRFFAFDIMTAEKLLGAAAGFVDSAMCNPGLRRKEL